MFRIFLVLIVMLSLGTSVAFAQGEGASVELKDAGGKVVGTATFTSVADGVQVSGKFSGLPPGQHGIHVHAAGICDPPAFTTAGGHFNSGGKQHGAKNASGAHAGDLGNLTIGADGTGTITAVAKGATLDGAETSLFHTGGTALVIHAGMDDEMTDPAGNSGARISCGVIVKMAAPAALPSTGGGGTATWPMVALVAGAVGLLVARSVRRSL